MRMGRRRGRRRRLGPAKSVLTAVAVVPPEDVWAPIQAIRQRYDRRFARWMPHITMIFPFVPRPQLEDAVRKLEGACEGVAPFDVTLGEFRYFEHPTGSATVWLAPEPAEPLKALHGRLLTVFPQYDDQLRPAGEFVPHLSVGQARSWDEAAELAEQFQGGWRPLTFRVEHVSVLVRGPESPFKEYARVRLRGGRSAVD